MGGKKLGRYVVLTETGINTPQGRGVVDWLRVSGCTGASGPSSSRTQGPNVRASRRESVPPLQ